MSEDLNKRIQTLETAVAQMKVAIQNLAAKRQLSHVASLMERQFSELKAEIADLKSQIAVIKKQ